MRAYRECVSNLYLSSNVNSDEEKNNLLNEFQY